MKLTQELVLQRTRTKKLVEVKSLNMWGQDVSDAEILLSMPNVEVLSFSVNSIQTLRCFQKCISLRELYLRKNDIKNLAEIQCLSHIKNLRVLWLSDNPCAECAEYRPTVVHYLPSLQKLDNVDITEEERISAPRLALKLPELGEEEPDSQVKAANAADIQPGPNGAECKTGGNAENDIDSLGSSSNILYAVIALLQELDLDSLRIVKAEIDTILSEDQDDAPPESQEAEDEAAPDNSGGASEGNSS